MKSEQIKQITSKAIEELVSALNSGRSEALTNYLAAMGRFHRYSFFNVMPMQHAWLGFRPGNPWGVTSRRAKKES
jgi:hypothetical protein